MFAYTLSKRDWTHPSMGVVPDSLALNGGAITSEATGAEADLRHDGTIIIGTRDDGGGGRKGTDPPRSSATCENGGAKIDHRSAVSVA